MRLSLMKAAHVAPFGTAYRKYGYLPDFGRCGIPRLSTAHPPLATPFTLRGRGLWNPTSREKRARCGAPVIRYAPGSEKLRLAPEEIVSVFYGELPQPLKPVHFVLLTDRLKPWLKPVPFQQAW